MSLASYQAALSRTFTFFVADLTLTPRGIRIPVSSVKGRCPRPLDDGGLLPSLQQSEEDWQCQ